MPIYEYQCTKCGHHLEVMQKVNDKPLTECPSCQETSLHKLVSAAAFQLKGSGWYATDFKNKPQVVPGTKSENKEASAKPGNKESADAGKKSTKKEETGTSVTKEKTTTTTTTD